MALGKINFAGVSTEFTPAPPGVYQGKTVNGWVAQPSKDGQSTNIVVKFSYDFEDANTGNVVTRQHTQYYNLKETALWRLKRDLLALGADPEAMESEDADLEQILDELFGTAQDPVEPIDVELTFSRQAGSQYNQLDKVVAL